MERNSQSNHNYNHDEIIEMLDIANRHIYPVWWASVSADDRYSDGRTNCPQLLLAGLFLSVYDTGFLQWFLKNKDKN